MAAGFGIVLPEPAARSRSARERPGSAEILGPLASA